MKELLDRIAARTDAAELFGLDMSVDLVGFESSRLKSLNHLAGTGAAVRALVGRRMGQAFASDLRHPERLAERVRELALLGDEVDFELAGPAAIPKLDLADPQLAALELAEMVRDGQAAIDTLLAYDDRALAYFTAERAVDRVQVRTSRGADVAYERVFATTGVSVELVEGHNVVRLARTRKGRHRLPPAAEMASELAGLLRVARKTVPFKPGKWRVLFAPAALADVLMAFTGAVDGDLVAKRVSPLAGRLGETVLDPRVTILDDPHHPDGIQSAPVDDEGTPTRRKAVIERGVLREYLADRRSAAALGIEPTGNAFRATPFERHKSFAVGLSTDFSNLVLAPGERPAAEIAADSRMAIEVHQINGILLGDMIGGDFSGSLEVAFLVVNGERVGRVKDAMIAGNFFRVFGPEQLADLSREQEWSGTFGGVSGSFLLPWVAAEGIDISGTD